MRAALVLVLSATALPALAALDPSTTAMANRYAQAAQTCMTRSLNVAVKAGQRSRPLLMQIATARCGNDWQQFLTVHGESVLQAQGELKAMASRLIDEVLKPAKRRG